MKLVSRATLAVDVSGLLAAGLILSAGWFVGVVLVSQARQRTDDLRAKIASAERRLSEARSLEALLRDEAQASWEKLDAQQMDLRPASALNQRLASVVGLAQEAGLVVEGVEPGKGVDVGMYEVLPIRLSGHGSFPDSTRFLDSLATRLPDTTVSSVSLGAREAATSTSFVFNLAWYAAGADDAGEEDSDRGLQDGDSN